MPSAHSSGSRMPAPVSSVCSTRRLLSTSASPSTPPDSARIAAATTFGRSGRGFGGQPLADAVDQRGAHAAFTAGCWCSTASTRRAAAASGDRRRSRKPAALERRCHAGLRPHRRQQRQSDDLRDIGRPQPAGRRAPHHHAGVGIDRRHPRRDRRGGGARAHVGGGDHDDEVRGVERGLGRGGRSPRHIADHRRAAASCPRRSPHPAARRRCRRRRDRPTSTLTPWRRGSASRSAA